MKVNSTPNFLASSSPMVDVTNKKLYSLLNPINLRTRSLFQPSSTMYEDAHLMSSAICVCRLIYLLFMLQYNQQNVHSGFITSKFERQYSFIKFHQIFYFLKTSYIIEGKYFKCNIFSI